MKDQKNSGKEERQSVTDISKYITNNEDKILRSRLKNMWYNASRKTKVAAIACMLGLGGAAWYYAPQIKTLRTENTSVKTELNAQKAEYVTTKIDLDKTKTELTTSKKERDRLSREINQLRKDLKESKIALLSNTGQEYTVQQLVQLGMCNKDIFYWAERRRASEDQDISKFYYATLALKGQKTIASDENILFCGARRYGLKKMDEAGFGDLLSRENRESYLKGDSDIVLKYGSLIYLSKDAKTQINFEEKTVENGGLESLLKGKGVRIANIPEEKLRRFRSNYAKR